MSMILSELIHPTAVIDSQAEPASDRSESGRTLFLRGTFRVGLGNASSRATPA